MRRYYERFQLAAELDDLLEKDNGALALGLALCATDVRLMSAWLIAVRRAEEFLRPTESGKRFDKFGNRLPALEEEHDDRT